LRLARTAQLLGKPPYGVHALDTDRDGKLRGLVLDGVEPLRIRVPVLEQSIARAQRALERAHAAPMLRIHCEHEAIEKAPALAGRPAEQPLHSRMKPDDTQMVGEGRS
jgi:nicotinamidase-related amidase